MIRAVIFDCFGVLTSEGWVPFRNEQFGADPAKMQQANILMRRLAVGQTTDEDFQAKIAQMAGVTPKTVQEHLYKHTGNDEMFAFMQTLKPQYKTAMLSNVGKNRLTEIFTPGQLALIDFFGLSSEIGYAKPDMAAYHHVATQLEVLPEECVFIDDQPRYIAGAEQTGMKTVLFQTTEQAIADAQRLLADS